MSESHAFHKKDDTDPDAVSTIAEMEGENNAQDDAVPPEGPQEVPDAEAGNLPLSTSEFPDQKST